MDTDSGTRPSALPGVETLRSEDAQASASSNITVWQGDAFALLPQVPDESVDLVVTDPPYASLEKHRATGTTTRLKKSKGSSNAWFPVIGNDRLPELLAQLWRVMRRNSHLFMFADEETAYLLKPMAERVGFTAWTSLTWVKTRTSMPDEVPSSPAEVAATMVQLDVGTAHHHLPEEPHPPHGEGKDGLQQPRRPRRRILVGHGMRGEQLRDELRRLQHLGERRQLVGQADLRGPHGRYRSP